jgi:hypothetical protein
MRVAGPSLRVCPERSDGIAEFSEHEADRGEAQECQRFAIEVLPIFGEPSATVEPGEGTLDDPALGQHRKSLLSERLTICVSRWGKIVRSALWNFGP